MPASIVQAHRATLLGGKEVIVKVPDIFVRLLYKTMKVEGRMVGR